MTGLIVPHLIEAIATHAPDAAEVMTIREVRLIAAHLEREGLLIGDRP
jgi:hypothetical protein